MQALLDSVKTLSGKERKALATLLKKQGINLYGVGPICPRDPEDSLVLSYAQQRQWFLWQMEPDSATYNMPTALLLKGELDIQALGASFEALMTRHETLRTTLHQQGEQVVQVIHPPAPLALEVKPLDLPAGSARDAAVKALVEAETRRPFDLVNGPLLRVKLLQLAADEHVLILTLHHIVSDGWSMPIMVGELVQLYQGLRTAMPVSLPALPIQYADYAQWQRQWMEAGELERQLEYWKAQLGDEQPVLELPTDRPRPAIRSEAGASLEIQLDTALAQKLKQLAQQQGTTLFMVLLASFQTLLQRYSGQNDIRVGIAIANRNRVETEGLIGFFVNTQVLRAEFDPHSTFSTLLAQVKQRVLGAQAHQDLPFEQLVEVLQPERSLSHSPLFQVMYNHQTQVKGQRHELPGLTVEGLAWETDSAKFDLMLDTFEHEEGIGASLNYATALFEPQTIAGMARHWQRLLEAIVQQPQQRLAELPLLNPQEQQQLVQDWNPSWVQHGRELCIHQAIERRAAAAPQAIAVAIGEQTLTYDALNQRANQFAHALRAQGVGPDVRVGLAVERSLDMVVGILAILKAGGAYVPLDPEYPEDRLTYMIEDSGIELLLTQAHLQAQLPIPASVRSVLLDAGQAAIDQQSRENPPLVSVPDNLAYVIYTSGSTGKPKGTLLPHHNVMRLFQSTQNWFNFNEQDVWTVFHSYAFDFSVWELFGALLYGGKAVLVPKEVARSPEELHALLVREQVTVLNQTPSAFKYLIPVACAARTELTLRYVVFGGEALDVASLQPWFARFGDARPQLVNMYGITETTVHVTYRPLSLADLQQDAVSPIGEVIPDLSWYLLDSQLNLTTPGTFGELHVGQAGLARGYHQRAALTAERFIPDPFDRSEQGGGRLYRTGDLARDRGEGVIEYVGRIDHQVKIRGFRIELGEIEAKLQQCAEVREAVVLDIDGPGGKQLVAYLIAEAGQNEDESALRQRLREQLKAVLPDYMVPVHWVFLEALPLTANGKLDRKALPKPDASQAANQYVAPQGELEQHLAAIWQEVLDVEQVGRHDNFFELGGHSLLATQVVARCRDSLPCPVQLRDLFNHPVLADLAAALQSAEVPSGPVYPRLVRNEFPDGVAPLSLAQRRLWVVEQLSGGGAAYGMPLALRLHGELSVERLLQSLADVVARHDVLRTAYLQDDEGDPIAVIQLHTPLNVPVIDISDWPRARQEEQVAQDTLNNARQPIDMERAPLWRARILKLAGDEHVLLFSMHHIISDGWSMGVLVNELVTGYGQLTQGLALDAPALPIQYADYAVWQSRLEESGVLGQQAAYWRDTLAGYSGQLNLPVDTPRSPKGDQQGGTVNFTLSEALSERLRSLAQAAGVTPYIALLTAFGMFLQRLSGSDDVVMGADIAGRHQPELEGLIGFFVNVLPLRSHFAAEVPFAERLVRMRQVVLDALEHQDLPFDQIVESTGAKRVPGMNPLVQVLFVMDNLPARASSLHGVRVEEVPNSQMHSKFDMALFMGEQDKRLGGAWQYASSLYQQETIETFVSAWTDTLEHITANQAFTVGDINMAVAPGVAPQVNVNSKEKADKLGKFLKKGGATARPVNAAVREYPLLPGQAFPLVMEPNDPGLDLVGWVAANRPLIEARLGENAGVLFRGFEVNGIEGFEAFAEAVQPGLYGQYGDLPKKEGGKNTYRSTPYPEQKMILFHNESSHQDRWPRKQMFYCELPSPIGGATPVVDCRVMYQRLPQALRQTLEEKGLLYIRTFTGFDVPWQHFFKTEERASVEARCRESGIEWQWLEDDGLQIRTWCPAIITHPVTGQRSFFNQVQLHHPFWLDADVRDDLVGMFGNDRLPRNVYYGDGSPIAEADLQTIGELYEACAVRFDWRKGDIILLDNMLVAHARDPFEGPRKIVVAMGDMVDRVALAETRPQMTQPAASKAAKENIDV